MLSYTSEEEITGSENSRWGHYQCRAHIATWNHCYLSWDHHFFLIIILFFIPRHSKSIKAKKVWRHLVCGNCPARPWLMNLQPDVHFKTWSKMYWSQWKVNWMFQITSKKLLQCQYWRKKKIQTGYVHWSFSLALILGGKSRKAKEQTQDPQLLRATRGLVIVMWIGRDYSRWKKEWI